MRRFLILLSLLAAGCSAPQGPSVMARHVPERADDFVFENLYIAGRIYGEALEKETLSPGIDIWVKLPGALVADEMYRQELEEGKTYHKFHGLGKDCYKVGQSLGGGASALLIDNNLQYPATNWRSYEILEQENDRIVFVLHYPEWTESGQTMSLDKKITVTAESHFCKVEDCWKFSGEYGDSLYVAAGVLRHPAQNTIEEELILSDRYAIWEKASDTSAESEDGMLGVAVFAPLSDMVCLSQGDEHGLCVKKIASGETFTYYFGNCWSKGGVATAQDWFSMVKSLE